MIYVWIGGGLGNQIYQYALYKQLEYWFGSENIKADTYYMRMSGIHNGYVLGKLGLTPKSMPLAMLGNKFTKKVGKLFEEDITPNNIKENVQNANSVYLRGFWQSLDYFPDVLDDVIDDVRFPLHKISSQNKKHVNLMHKTNSIAVHVRRGNYFKSPERYNVFGKFCDNPYHNEAIKQMQERVDNPYFFVFSDDIEYCRNNLQFSSENAIYVYNNKGKNSFWDMYLMSQCKHNIIANSTFSWWGAFLNQNKQKNVIAPKYWFENDKVTNRIPKEWTIIDNMAL